MSRRLLISVALTGVVATVGAAVLVLFAHDFMPYRPAEKVAQVVTDAIWITAGLIAWRRRPGNRVGPLMTALGFAELLPKFFWDAALPFTVAQLISWFTLPLSTHLFLAFPSGRLATRFERGFVASVYVAIPLFSPISQLFWDPQGTDCPECPRNLLLVNADPRIWSFVSPVGDVIVGAMLATAVFLLIGHVRRA